MTMHPAGRLHAAQVVVLNVGTQNALIAVMAYIIRSKDTTMTVCLADCSRASDLGSSGCVHAVYGGNGLGLLP